MTGVRVVLLLLISVPLWSSVRAGLQRRFSLQSGLNLSWSKAVSSCRDQDSNLAVILDSGQNSQVLQTFSSAPAPSSPSGDNNFPAGQVWTGLSRPWSWSLGSETEPVSGWVLPWAEHEPQEARRCVALQTQTGRFVTVHCARNLTYFTCDHGGKMADSLHKQSFTWTQARDYCRSQSADLSSLRDQNQIQQFLDTYFPTTTTTRTSTTNTTKTTTASVALQDPPLVWIGLNRLRWVWSDSSPVSWSNWRSSPSDSGPDCVAMATDGTWIQEDCTNERRVVCHKDFQDTMRTAVKLRLNPGSADLNDPVVQQSLLNQMAQRLQEAGVPGVKLTWGQCKKLEKTAPPTDCELLVQP